MGWTILPKSKLKEQPVTVAEISALEKRLKDDSERERRKSEAIEINAMVKERLRRYSNESMDSVTSSTSDSGGNPSAPPKTRRKSTGYVTEDELLQIQKKIAESKESLPVLQRAKRLSKEKNGDSSESPAQSPQQMPTGAGSEEPSPMLPPQSSVPPSPMLLSQQGAAAAPSQTQVAPGLSGKLASKWGLARDRLAAMRAEKEAYLKAEAYLGDVNSNNGSSHEGSAPAIGTAKAAAKLAGGVFYTNTENRDLCKKLRDATLQNKELEARNRELEAKQSELEARCAELEARFSFAQKKQNSKTGLAGYFAGAVTDTLVNVFAGNSQPSFTNPSPSRDGTPNGGRPSPNGRRSFGSVRGSGSKDGPSTGSPVQLRRHPVDASV